MKLTLRSLPLVRQLQILFFISGFSALVLEVVYVKLLRYWAGNTASAVAAVLCAYMAGLAVGSFLAGRWLLRLKHLLALYGGLELLVGLYSVGLPWLMERLKPAYLNVTLWLGPDTGLALCGHFLATVTLLLVPTLLMGASFPVVVRAASRASEDRADIAEKLYAANLIGAAAGTFLSDFLLIRFWGLGNSLVLVAAVSAVVATWAMALDRHHPVLAAARTESRATVQPRASRGSDLVLVVALAGGFLVLFQEIVWTHMVGRFLDSTVYGFAITLFGVIAGLGLGAALVARNVAKRPARVQLPWVSMAAGLLVVLLIPFWDEARTLAVRYPLWAVYVALAVLGAVAIALVPQPETLACVLAGFPALLGVTFLYRRLDPTGAVFWTHHGVDFAVSGLFMFAPAVLMGMVFPLTLEWYLGSARGGAPTVAPIYAVNTLGSMAGVVVANFLVIPLIGLERSGRFVGCAFLALGLLLLARMVRQRYAVAFAIVPALAWVLFVPRWDYSKTHALMGHAGELIYAQEDLNGGVTTVLQNIGEKNLYVNGLLQAGNTYLVQDQARCALVPLLYAREFDRAMIIGIGSGQTGGLVGLYPFKTIDVVDFSPRVVEAARRFFEDTNLGLFNNPRVRLHIADGRHFLLTHPEKLSLLTIEVNRLWVAGEGDLYTREFYELCSARLVNTGILQQWVPLFDLSLRDTVIILRTVRQVFPYVALYMGAESGMIVASRSPLEVDYARLREMDSQPQLGSFLASIQLPRIFSLLGDCIFVPEGLDAFLERSPERRISTDLRPHLEYSNAQFYLVNPSSRALRLHLLSAQEFRTPPITGADRATLQAIQEYAFAERSRLVQTFPPH
ncbi:MAG: fused MFS/spermidine synthase [Terriglobia bacterium]